MLAEDLGDLRGILLVNAKPRVESAKSPERQEGVEGRTDQSKRISPPAKLIENG